jgi:hypothetical protein
MNSFAQEMREENGEWLAQSFTSLNALNCLDRLQINFQNKKIQSIAKKSTYLNWLVNFKTFDYSLFSIQWYKYYCPEYIAKSSHSIKPLKKVIIQSLATNFDPVVAEKFFSYQ